MSPDCRNSFGHEVGFGNAILDETIFFCIFCDPIDITFNRHLPQLLFIGSDQFTIKHVDLFPPKPIFHQKSPTRKKTADAPGRQPRAPSRASQETKFASSTAGRTSGLAYQKLVYAAAGAHLDTSSSRSTGAFRRWRGRTSLTYSLIHPAMLPQLTHLLKHQMPQARLL